MTMQEIAAALVEKQIQQQTNGTWTLTLEVGLVQPIIGIPNKELAEHIREQMWRMYKAGEDNYAESTH